MAFTKKLSKEVRTNFMEQYHAGIKGTACYAIGMNDDIKRFHRVSQTKELFAFDDGLAAKQAPFIFSIRPLVSGVQSL